MRERNTRSSQKSRKQGAAAKRRNVKGACMQTWLFDPKRRDKEVSIHPSRPADKRPLTLHTILQPGIDAL